MPVETYNLSVGGDFSPLFRQAEESASKIQNLFNRRLNSSSLTRPLGQITSSTDEFSKSMAAANARVIAFGASAGLIFQVSQGIKSLVSSTIEVNKSFTELNTLLNQNAEELSNFKNEIFSIAKDTGQSFSEIAAGATELARQGLGAEETLIRLKDAAILSRQAGISLEDSVESLTASVNSFSKAGLTSTEVINKFANVDAAFAVSSKDLAEALKRVGSTAAEAGVSIDSLIGFVTSAQQTTARGGAVIGNALKTIFTRIERPEVIAQLESLGTVVRGAGQQILPVSEILKNFAGTFNSASDSQQSYLAELVGSVYQINILKALLGDLSKEYSVVDQATQKSAQSQNEASKRNEEYNKSLASVLNKSKETFRQLGETVGNLTIAPVIKNTTGIVESLFGDVGEQSKGIGRQIADGALKGLGEFIAGPGLAIVSIAVGKLALSFAEFTADALKSFAGLNKFALQQKQISEALKDTLSFEPGLREKILNKTISQVEVERTLLSLTQQRLEAISRLDAVTSKASANFLKSNQIGFDKAGKIVLPNSPGKTAAGGLIPEETKEKVGALLGGYEAGSIKRMSVPGMGNVIYNSKEQVKDFGMSQPAILPPKNSEAGTNYKKAFEDVHGFDPYKNFAAGLVPNYRIQGEQIGEIGQNARFLDLKQLIGGVPVGFKQFKKFVDPREIEKEYLISKYLESISLPGVKFPKIFKSLNNSLSEGGIYKEFIKDPTSHENSSDAVTRLFSTSYIGKAFENFDLNHGITPDDLHLSNFTVNDRLSRELSALANSRNSANFLSGFGDKNSQTFAAMVANGSLATVIDPGEFKLSKSRLKELKSQFGAAGIVPNYASNLFSSINLEDRLVTDPKSYSNFSLTPDEFISKALSTESFEKYSNFILGKVGATPKLDVAKDFRKIEGKLSSSTKAVYDPDLITLNFDNLAGKLDDNFGFKGGYGQLSGRMKEDLQSISARKTSRALIHEYSHFLDDKLDITSRIPSKIFDETHSQLGGKTLNTATGISVAGENDFAKISNKIVNVNKLESVAEAITNAFAQPKLKFLVKNGTFGRSREVGLNDLSLTKYLRDSGLIPASKGLIPNYSSLSKAVSREVGAGVSPSLIKASSSPFLKSPLNPAGLGVYNTKDEPLGLNQGINRALSQGLNPKTHGAADGLIPNYAPDFASSSETFKPFTPASKREEFQRVLEDLKSQIKNDTFTFKDVDSKIKDLSEEFSLTAKGVKSLRNSLTRSVNYNKNAYGFFPDEPKGEIKFSSMQNYLAGKKERESLESEELSKRIGSKSKLIQNSGYDSFFLKENFSFRNPSINKLGGSEVINDLISSFSNKIKTGEVSSKKKNVENFKNVIEQNIRKLGGTSDDFTEVNRIINDIVPLSRKMKGEYFTQLKIQEKKTAKLKEEEAILQEKIDAAGSLKSLFFGETRTKANQLKNENRERYEAAKQSRDSKLNTISIAAGFAAPILGGIGSQLFTDETKNQRGFGQLTQSVGNVASYAGLGAVFGAPGIAAGAAIGVATEFPRIFEAFISNLPDLQKNLERINTSYRENSENLSNYIKLEDSLRNSRGLSSEKISELQKEQKNIFGNLSLEQRGKINQGLSTGGFKGLQEAVKEIIDSIAFEKKNADFAVEFGSNTKKDVSKLGRSENINNKLEKFSIPNRDRLEEAINNRRTSVGSLDILGAGADPSYDLGVLQDLKFRTRENVSSSESFNRFINQIPFKNGQNLQNIPLSEVVNFKKDIEEGFKKFDPLSPASSIEASVKAFENFINKSNLPDTQKFDAIQSLKEGAKTNPIEFIDKFQRFLEQNLSGDAVLKRVNREALGKSERERTLETTSDFSASLFRTIEVINNFKTVMSSVNEEATANLEFQKKSNSLRFENFAKIQENFAGPKTLTNLRFQNDRRQIEEERVSSIAKINQNFVSGISDSIDNGALSILKKRIEEAFGTGTEATGDGKSAVRKANEFTAPLLDLKESIAKSSSSGDFGSVFQQIDKLQGFLEKSIVKLDPLVRPDGTAETTADQKKLLEELNSTIKNLGISRGLQVGSVENRNKELVTLSEEKRRAEIDLIDLQKKLSVGGGAGNILSNSANFKQSILTGNTLSELGAQIGDFGLSGQGKFQNAKLLQSLGVDVQGTSLFEPLVSDLANTIKQNFPNDLLPASPEEIARKQLTNEFKTETKQDEILRQSSNLYSEIKLNSQNLDSILQKLSSDNGFNVSVKNVAELVAALRGEKYDGSRGAIGDPISFYASAGKSNPLAGDPLFDAFGIRTPNTPVVPLQQTSSKYINPAPSAGEERTLSEALTEKAKNIQFDTSGLTARRTRESFASLLSQLLNSDQSGKIGEDLFRKQAVFQATGDNGDANQAYSSVISSLDNRANSAARLAALSKDGTENLRESKNLRDQLDKLEKKSIGNGLSAIEIAKKQLTLTEKFLAARSKEAYNRGDISGKDYNAQLRLANEKSIQSKDFKISQAASLFGNELTAYNSQDYYKEISDGAVTTAATIKSEFSSAFKSFADGTKDADDAFRSFGNSVLKRVQDLSIDLSTNLLFSYLGEAGKSVASAFGSSSTSQKKNMGGKIMRYSSGGRVKGGSGTRDDVPAMLTEGEYVIKRSAVQAIGEDYLNELNKNSPIYGDGTKLPKKSRGNQDFGAAQVTRSFSEGDRSSIVLNNAFAYNDAKRPTGGYFNVSNQLSALGQTDENNPANRLKFEREQELIGYLGDRKDYDKNRRLTLRNFNRQRNNSLRSAYISAGIQVGAYGLGQIGSSSSNTKKLGDGSTITKGSDGYIVRDKFGGTTSYNSGDTEVAAIFNGLGRANGGIIKKYAGGGTVFGGNSSTDKIPAMLTGGEFVVKKSAVDKYGTSFFNNINNGRKYAEGGYVGSYSSNGNESNYMDKISSVISELSEAVKSLKSNGKNDSGSNNQVQSVTGGTNNISITVNVSKEGSVESKTSSDSSGSRSGKDQENSKKFAELVKSKVVEVIIEQKKNGGLLSPNS